MATEWLLLQQMNTGDKKTEEGLQTHHKLGKHLRLLQSQQARCHVSIHSPLLAVKRRK